MPGTFMFDAETSTTDLKQSSRIKSSYNATRTGFQNIDALTAPFATINPVTSAPVLVPPAPSHPRVNDEQMPPSRHLHSTARSD